ncbi:MAG: hypothetical protein CXZ00_15740 [Acidobacteria bacterium]|nr:MAG: hypothetical protein CXZ00_15740 [Acidobacteriota bacterium]
MDKQLKISARNAGQVELEKFCPRCCWYLLRMKKMPFQFGMPGIMFYLERIEKAFTLAYLAKSKAVPKYFGPFADCTETVEFPFEMSYEHDESGVLVTARPDLILRKKDGNLCLLDLKTSKPDGGGRVYLPQYEIQTIGYSWVAEASGLGKVGTAGLLYAEVQTEQFLKDPLKYKTDTGLLVPFDFKGHEVKLNYSRLTRCLKVVKKLWNDDHPPKGSDNCKDCQLLTRLIDFENELRLMDQRIFASFPEHRNFLLSQDYYRRLTRMPLPFDDMNAGDTWDQDGGMWANWEFC